MDLDPGSLLGWVAIAVSVILGTRGGIWKNTIAAQKELIVGYEQREEKHRDELERIKRERDEKDARTDAALKRLGDRNQVLEELILNRSEIAQVVDVMERHDNEAARRHEGILNALVAIQEAQERRGAGA